MKSCHQSRVAAGCARLPRTAGLCRARTAVWLALSLAAIGSAHAGNSTWFGGVGDWEAPANWSPAGPSAPGPGDTATLASGITTLSSTRNLGSLNLAGGLLIGTGTLTVDGAALWTAGSLNNIVNFNGPLAISGAGDKSIRGVVNASAATTTTWSGNTVPNNNLLGNDGTFNNNGTFTDQNKFDSSLSVFTFNNAGTFQKANNTLTTVSGSFSNTGNVDVQAGEMRLTNSRVHTGSFNVAAGATLNFSGGVGVTLNQASFSGPGLLRLSGAFVQFTNMAPVANPLSFDGGSITGTATFSGPATWTSGAVGVGATVNFNGPLAISGAGDKSLRGVVNTSAATTTTWSGNTVPNNNLLGDTGTFNNNGTFTDQNKFDSSLSVFTFNNAGTFQKTNNTLTTVSGSFGNSGNVDVQAGTMLLTRVFTNAGLINVQAAATLQSSAAISPPAIAFANAGTLQGNGTVRTAANGALVNSGILAAGTLGQVGHLTLDGALEMTPTGTFAVDIAGLASFDLLSVTKNVSLLGTIAVNVLPGFTLAEGESFTVLAFAGQRLNSSVFQNITWRGTGGLGFVADYNLHDVTLRVVAVPEPASWLLMAAGLFAIARLKRLRGRAEPKPKPKPKPSAGVEMQTQTARPWVLLTLVASLAGCQSYRDLATRGSNAFHEIQLEVTPEVRKQATIENLKIERKAQAGASFVVSGDISYPQPCKSALMLGVSFVNEKGVILANHPAMVRSYPGAVMARFASAAYINAKVGQTQDIIDKVVVNELRCV